MEIGDWETVLTQLEHEATSLSGDRMQTQELKNRVEKALQYAESVSADAEAINRLDMMLMVLTEKAKENVCTNQKCPHYNKKCKMR
jgi:hypothetical protein